MMESLLGIRRAGADFIVTYFATEAASNSDSGRNLTNTRARAAGFRPLAIES